MYHIAEKCMMQKRRKPLINKEIPEVIETSGINLFGTP